MNYPLEGGGGHTGIDDEISIMDYNGLSWTIIEGGVMNGMGDWHGWLARMTGKYDWHGWLAWVTGMDDWHGWLAWMTGIDG